MDVCGKESKSCLVVFESISLFISEVSGVTGPWWGMFVVLSALLLVELKEGGKE